MELVALAIHKVLTGAEPTEYTAEQWPGSGA